MVRLEHLDGTHLTDCLIRTSHPYPLRPGAFPLLGLLPSLWGMLGEKKNERTLQESVRGYDVQILLKETAAGDRLVQSIVFKRR